MYIRPSLKKCPDNVTLQTHHLDSMFPRRFNVESTWCVCRECFTWGLITRLGVIRSSLTKLLDLKKFITRTLITRTDNGNASLTEIKTNEHLHGLQMDIIDNGDKISN